MLYHTCLWLVYNCKLVSFDSSSPILPTHYALPLVTISLFSVSMSLFVGFLFSTYKWDRTVSVFLYLKYLTQHMPSSFIHVVTNRRMSFFLMAECHHTYTYRIHLNIYMSIHTHHIFLIHLYSSVNWHRFFSFLVVSNNAAMNTGVQRALQHTDFISLVYFPEVGMPDIMGDFIFHSLSNYHNRFP